MADYCCDGSLDFIDDDNHSLLDQQDPVYSSFTIRRAFTAWLYCGQGDNYEQICKFYHNLEALEEKMSPKERAISQHHDFNLYSNYPPNSPFLKSSFPSLYKNEIRHSDKNILKNLHNPMSAYKQPKEIFEYTRKELERIKEIDQTSKIIRKYCKDEEITLKKFYLDYQGYLVKCHLDHSIPHVMIFLYKRRVHSEMSLIDKMPETLSIIGSTSTIPINLRRFPFKRTYHEYDEKEIAAAIKPIPRKPFDDNENGKKLNPICAAFFRSFEESYSQNRNVFSNTTFANGYDNHVFYNGNAMISLSPVESLISMNISGADWNTKRVNNHWLTEQWIADQAYYNHMYADQRYRTTSTPIQFEDLLKLGTV